MVDASEYRRWRSEADAAARGARLQGEEALHNWACFQAEQSAQLALKGLLHGIGAGAWGHDLVALGAAMAEALGSPLPDALAAALQRLSRHYIPTRYPDAHPSGAPGVYYGAEDVRQALSDLDATLAYVDARWRELAGKESS